MTGPNGAGGGPGREPILTVPNVIVALRVLGLGPLLWAAHAGHRQAFLWIMLALILSDWVDGKLAVLLDQETELGARIDSLADALMSGALGLAFWIIWRNRTPTGSSSSAVFATSTTAPST